MATTVVVSGELEPLVPTNNKVPSDPSQQSLVSPWYLVAWFLCSTGMGSESILGIDHGANKARQYLCMYVCMVITFSRVWINRVRLPILLVVN